MDPAKHKSKNVLNLADPRIRRTVDFLDEALTALLLRRSYDTIRVGDIARKAGVGRATFYAHFGEKDELLQMQIEQVISRLVMVDASLPWVVDATRLFAHLREYPQIYHSLANGHTGLSVLKMAQMVLEQRILAAAGNANSLPTGLHARFVAASLFVLIEWWSENGLQQSPEEMQTSLTKLIRSQTVSATLDRNLARATQS